MKNTTPKTEGNFAATKAKVRELKGVIIGLKDDLIEMNHRNDGLRQANAHASSVCSDLEAKLYRLRNHEMKILALQSEIGKLVLSSEQSEYLLKQSLAAEKQRADDLYTANQKFAEDDHEYRLSTQAAQNRLVNDNLHQADEIDRLKTYSVAQSEEIGRLNVCMVTRQEQVDDLLKQIRELKAEVKRLGTAVSEAQLIKWAEVQAQDARQFILREEVTVRSLVAAHLDHVNRKDLQIANLQQTLDRERSSHTITFIAKAERIDELLIIEKNLTDENHEMQKYVTELLDMSQGLLNRVNDKATVEITRQSLLSRVWQWLNSPY